MPIDKNQPFYKTPKKSPKLLSFADLRAVKGISFSRAHIYRMIDKGTFPKSIQTGEKSVAFVEEEIDQWIEQKIAERDAATTA
jgi:prophage regulatory protein